MRATKQKGIFHQSFKRIIQVGLLALVFMGATFPDPKGAVNDFAGVLKPDASAALEAKLTSLHEKTGLAVVVATVGSLEDVPIEDYANQLYSKWGIGKKGEDKGVLMLVAPSERKIRIEVGYGLEGSLNDAAAGRIIREIIIPYFKANDIQGGILSGVDAIILSLAKGEKFEIPEGVTEPKPPKKSLGQKIIDYGFLLVLLILFIKYPKYFLFIAFFSGGRVKGRSGGGFSSSGSSGGFGGFGGGSSGGGGATGSW